MKKTKISLIDRARDMENAQDDPVDGVKMLGCLFVGILLLAAMLSIFGFIIKSLR